MSPNDTAAAGGDMSLTVLIIVADQDRSRDFYHHVIAAEIVRDRDPVILRFRNSMIVLNVGGGPTSDKPTVTMAPPRTRTLSASPSTSAWPTSRPFTVLGGRGARSSSRPPKTATVRSAATCATGRTPDRSRPDHAGVRPASGRGVGSQPPDPAARRLARHRT
jgi:hypothetical protein